MGSRSPDEVYLPLRYEIKDGKPATVLPYDVFSNDGELTRAPAAHPHAAGFAVWLERQVTIVGSENLANEMEIDGALIRRWIHGGYNDGERWVTMDSIALSRIDQAMTLAGGEESIWTLYPYLDDDLEVAVAYCHRCREDVMPVGGVCPWCESRIITLDLLALPAPGVRSPYRRRKTATLRTVKRPKVGQGGWEPIARPVGVLKPAGPPRPRSTRDRKTDVTEHLAFEAAYRYYLDEWGFDRIAKLLLPLTRYSSYKTLSSAIYREFKVRGWPRRDRIEATRLASYKHGLAPRRRTKVLGAKAEGNYRRWLKHQRGEPSVRCRGKVTQGPRKGGRCLRPAMHGATLCNSHAPTAGQLRAIGAMNAGWLASHLPPEPLAAYLEERRKDFPSWRAMAILIAGPAGKPATWQSGLKRIVDGHRSGVRRSTADQILEAIGEGLTVEDLYRPFLRKAA
jgi:hypothetical protein